MKKFKLMKWVGMGACANATEFVLRGTLMDIVNYAKVNGLSFTELPGHLLGGYFTKPVDKHTADAYEVVPVRGVA